MVPTCCLCIFQLYFSISQLYFSISKLHFSGFQRKVMVPPCCLWPPLPHSPAVPPLLDWIAKEQWILLTKSGNGETVSLYTSKHILIQKSWFFCLHGKKHTLSERGGINRIKLHICKHISIIWALQPHDTHNGRQSFWSGTQIYQIWCSTLLFLSKRGS